MAGATVGGPVRFRREPLQPVAEPQSDTHSGAEPEREPGWRTDLAASLASVGLGAWLFRETFSFSVTASERVGGGIDAAGYPRLLAGLTMALGLALAARALWKWRAARAATPPAAGAEGQGGGKVRAALSFAVLLLYTLLLEPLGFLLATPLAVGVLLRITGGRGVLHAAVAFTAAIFVFFRYGVNIVLPEGLLRGISP